MAGSGSSREMLVEKRNLLSKILEISSKFKFTDAADDAEKYIELISARKKLFVKLKAIDEELAQHRLSADAEPLLSEIKSIAKRISDIDKEMSKSAQLVMSALKNNIKEIKTGKSAAKQYQSQYFGDVSSFDMSQ